MANPILWVPGGGGCSTCREKEEEFKDRAPEESTQPYVLYKGSGAYAYPVFTPMRLCYVGDVRAELRTNLAGWEDRDPSSDPMSCFIVADYYPLKMRLEEALDLYNRASEYSVRVTTTQTRLLGTCQTRTVSTVSSQDFRMVRCCGEWDPDLCEPIRNMRQRGHVDFMHAPLPDLVYQNSVICEIIHPGWLGSGTGLPPFLISADRRWVYVYAYIDILGPAVSGDPEEDCDCCSDPGCEIACCTCPRLSSYASGRTVGHPDLLNEIGVDRYEDICIEPLLCGDNKVLIGTADTPWGSLPLWGDGPNRDYDTIACDTDCAGEPPPACCGNYVTASGLCMEMPASISCDIRLTEKLTC